MSASWILKLNESDSRLHKESVLTEALTSALLGSVMSIKFLELVHMAYNPYITFGVKQVPVSTGIVEAENPWDEFTALLKKLSSRQLTGNAARDAISLIMHRFDSTEWNLFCSSVLKKDLRCGISDKTINKVVKDTAWQIPVFSCQLATDCEGRPEMSGVKRLEPKIDGVRVLMLCSASDDGVTVQSYSRNGLAFLNFTHIEHEIASQLDKMSVKLGYESFVLDGEVASSSFNSIMRQARRKKDADASDAVFYVFDLVPLNEFTMGRSNSPLYRRMHGLDCIRPNILKMKSVKFLPHLNVDLSTAEGNAEFDRYTEECVQNGFEGVMIKDPAAPYLCKRTTHWLKWKPTITVDVRIDGYEEGTGKHVGKLGALLGSGVDSGRAFSVWVGSGYSDDERDSLWTDRAHLKGRIMEVVADGVTQNQDGTYSLRFPRFQRFRDTFTGEKE